MIQVKGILTEITSMIYGALQQAAQQCKQDLTPLSFVSTSGDGTNKSLGQLA
jgi:hypothetical protein